MKQLSLGRFSDKCVTNPERHLLSSRCSKSQHGLCTGYSRRTDDKVCPCYCHKGDAS